MWSALRGGVARGASFGSLQLPVQFVPMTAHATVLVQRRHGSTTAVGEPGVQAEIGELVKAHKVVVFMKGVKQQPQCGFSKTVVQILDMHGVHDFHDVNVLADDKFRQGVKDFSKWPTIPQVFIGGEFVGGSDILLQMHRSGELMDTLKKAGIHSTIPDPPKTETPAKDKKTAAG
ncbi:uncharacterized monothiol glutaredoxin ycf64-like [Paramacrobiotus metropolitanus]|uniref:uncharacterized monothiol glutaredoxin ycf64-like n=1 Tax=Paramacrobiotus metropolitanus TaxID=2943436 RepID=UPI002445F25A|nr:uncharacterized monothiol glutaredoxin ycf64-like [Paramacrobiotus metropolitanus]